jgi:hypothetical protein
MLDSSIRTFEEGDAAKLHRAQFDLLARRFERVTENCPSDGLNTTKLQVLQGDGDT